MTDLTTEALNVRRTQNQFFQLSASGLRPNTKHNITLDGIDQAAVTRQFGKAPGEDLISDDNGELVFGLLFELEFGRERNFELPTTQSTAFQDNIVNQQGSRQNNSVVADNRILQLISPDGQSQVQFVIKFNVLLTAGPVTQQFPIE